MNIDEYNEMKSFIQRVANDYIELSTDKAIWQRDDYIARARQLMKKYENKNKSTYRMNYDDDF